MSTTLSPFSRWLRSTPSLQLIPGLALCAVMAAIALAAADMPLLAERGVSALTVALVLGLLVGNTVSPRISSPCTPGVGLAKAQLLRAGIVLYGMRLTFQDIAHLGWAGIVIDALVLSSTFLLAQWLGQRVLKLDARTALLVGAGSSICGAAAVLATAPVAKGRASDVAVAVATVVVFGTIATFLYPALFHWNQSHAWLEVSAAQYGLFVGSTVHEVAQVVAAGEAIGREAADMAVIAKMARVMMLAPFLLALSWWLSRRQHGGDGSAQPSGCTPVAVPWFALGFVALTGIHSLGVVPAAVVPALVQLDTVLLTLAMAALGLSTHLSAVRAAGAKPLLLAAMLMVWLMGAGLLLNGWIPRLL